jgi:hypothetical protein
VLAVILGHAGGEPTEVESGGTGSAPPARVPEFEDEATSALICSPCQI